MALIQNYRDSGMDVFHKDQSKFVEELQNVLDNNVNERADAAKRHKSSSAQVELNEELTKFSVRMDLIGI